MMTYRILQRRECAIVHERRLQRDITKRRRTKLVTMSRVAGDLFPAEVLILARSVKIAVGHGGGNLRDADNVVLKIAEHLIRVARYGMTLRTAGLAEKQ